MTERFKPLHREGTPRLQGDSHAHDDRTSVLPGVFFIYDLSPFAVCRVYVCDDIDCAMPTTNTTSHCCMCMCAEDGALPSRPT